MDVSPRNLCGLMNADLRLMVFEMRSFNFSVVVISPVHTLLVTIMRAPIVEDALTTHMSTAAIFLFSLLIILFAESLSCFDLECG